MSGSHTSVHPLAVHAFDTLSEAEAFSAQHGGTVSHTPDGLSPFAVLLSADEADEWGAAVCLEEVESAE